MELTLFGPFKLTVHGPGAAHETILIPSTKARGLLALLATAPEMSCRRSWLRNMLWSDRARAQAAASLRQELLNLARLNPILDAALARSRNTIALDPDIVRVLPAPDAPTRTIFLEDIDIQDRSFATWLAQRRGTHETPAFPLFVPYQSTAKSAETQRTLAFKTSAASQDPNSFLETTLSHFIGQGLNEHILVDVVDSEAARGIAKVTWIEIHAVPRDPKQSVVRISVKDGPRKSLIWSDLQTIPSTDLLDINHPFLLSYCNQAVQGILNVLSLRLPGKLDALETGLLAHLATRKIFSINRKEMRAADQLLEIADARTPRGVFRAWRALIRSIQLIEKHDGDPEQLRQDMQQFCHQALRMEPANATVLAIVANTRLEQGDNVTACAELALQSVRLNPSNPFAWDSLSMARLYQNDHAGAHELAIRAQMVSVGTPHSFWWNMGRAVSATAVGHLDEAIRYAELSQAQAPLFKPPKRYLAALYSAKGRESDVISTVDDIRRDEPAFLPIQLAEDPHYPSSILRVHGMYDIGMLRALS